jgi:predicted Zn finger-like uncharacterized protein
MILTCPECATRYDIDSAKFPAAGRKVRCKKCGHVWFQAGEASEAVPESVAAPTPIPAPAPVAEDTEAPPPATVAAPEPEAEPDASTRAYRGKITDAEAIAPKPVAKKAQPKSKGGWPRTMALVLGWVALMGAILIIGWATMTYREQIAKTWPKSASLFARVGMAVNTRGLNFTDVQHKDQIEDGQPVLVITGKLVNGSAQPVAVPHLSVTLSDDDKHPLYRWNFAAAAKIAGPGQAVAFRTRLSNPPFGARRVDIRFADNAE